MKSARAALLTNVRVTCNRAAFAKVEGAVVRRGRARHAVPECVECVLLGTRDLAEDRSQSGSGVGT